MLTPVILGMDKTTVSVATGHQEYHPVYMSLGNIHNEMRRAHGDGVVPVAFLAIPKRMSRFKTPYAQADPNVCVFSQMAAHQRLTNIARSSRSCITRVSPRS